MNAGGSYQPGAITARGIRREIAALLKDKSVMYDQTTAVKRRYLYQLFVDGHPLRGALVQITQSPYDVPSDLAPAPNESEPDDMQLRAKAALAFFDRVENTGFPGRHTKERVEFGARLQPRRPDSTFAARPEHVHKPDAAWLRAHQDQPVRPARTRDAL